MGRREEDRSCHPPLPPTSVFHLSTRCMCVLGGGFSSSSFSMREIDVRDLLHLPPAAAARVNQGQTHQLLSLLPPQKQKQKQEGGCQKFLFRGITKYQEGKIFSFPSLFFRVINRALAQKRRRSVFPPPLWALCWTCKFRFLSLFNLRGKRKDGLGAKRGNDGTSCPPT